MKGMRLRAIIRLAAIICLVLPVCSEGETTAAKNGPTSWTHDTRPLWSRLIYYKNINTINFGLDDYAYLGMDNATIAISNDNGQSFRQVKVPIQGAILQISSSNTGTVVVWNSGSYAISYDHGATWMPYRLEPSTTIRNASTPNDRPGIAWLELVTSYRPGDDRAGNAVLRRHARDRAGLSDQKLDQEFNLIRSVGDTKGWGIKDTRIFTTEDGGLRWTAGMPLPLQPGEYVYQTRTVDDELTVATSTGRLFEGGGTWRPLPSIPSDRLFTVVFTGGTSAMALTMNNVILFTKDYRAGKWDQRIAEVSVSAALGWRAERFLILSQSGQLRAVEAKADNETIVIDARTGDVQGAAVDDLGHIVLSTNRGELLTSSDSGQSWRIALRVRGTLGPIGLGPDGHGVAVVNGTDIRQTMDGGQTWHPRDVELPGPVVSIAMSAGGRGIAQVRRGDTWRSEYLLYNIEDERWTPAPPTASFSFLRWGGLGRLFGITYRGAVRVSSDNGRTWTGLSSDISDAFVKAAKDSDLIPEVVDAHFLDENNGWVIGTQWMVFHTENGGRTWSRVKDAQFADSDFKAVHFFDAEHGFIYDASGSQWFYKTNDAGKTWNYYDPLANNNLTTMAFSRIGTGIFAGSTGVQALGKLEIGPDLRGTTQASGLDSVRLTLMREDRPIRIADLKTAPKLMVRVKGKTEWATTDLPKTIFTETAEGLTVEWRPSDQNFRIDPNQIISQKIEIEDQDGFITDVSFGEFRYQPLLQKYRKELIWSAVIVSVLIASIGMILTFYQVYPRVLILIMSKQDDINDTLKGIHLEALIPVLRVLFFHNVLQWICLRRRVQEAWASGYLAGDEKIDELPESLRREMTKTDLFLDTWVRRRLDAVRDRPRTQLAVVASDKYIPLPVTLRVGNTTEDLREPSAMSLRRTLLADRHSIGIVAGGGRGKTTLAGQIGLWLMEAEPEQRMISDRPVLAVLTTGEVTDVIAAIRTALQAGHRDDDPMAYDSVILEEALRRGRLVLIADGLSELGRSSVDRLQDAMQTVPIALLIYTARKRFPELSARGTEINPQEIEKDGVSRFIAQYVFLNQLELFITARDQLLLSEKVIDLVETRPGRDTLPALFLRILAQTFEKADEAQRSAWRNAAPLSLAETAQRFVRELRLPADLAAIDADTLAQGATALARLSLDPFFVVRPFSSARAQAALVPFREPEKILLALEECTVIQREVTATGARYRFYLDPIAEYLAASSWMVQCGDDLPAWAAHIEAVWQSIQGGQVAYGYLDAMADCIAAQAAGSETPELVRAWALRADRAQVPLSMEPA